MLSSIVRYFGGIVVLCFTVLHVEAAPVSIGAAPKGDDKKVAERIIKFNFPRKCKRVTKASRLPDGTIHASCSGVDYRVFTMYSADEGKMLELALNCKEAGKIGISCF